MTEAMWAIAGALPANPADADASWLFYGLLIAVAAVAGTALRARHWLDRIRPVDTSDLDELRGRVSALERIHAHGSVDLEHLLDDDTHPGWDLLADAVRDDDQDDQ